mmetsp:Transcript_71684/g.184877  ORF Transcript_71684/g.184877 Transcript_71684/m.184877 type:complete len:204 (-) Transcript_71684:632-1243(-)
MDETERTETPTPMVSTRISSCGSRRRGRLKASTSKSMARKRHTHPVTGRILAESSSLEERPRAEVFGECCITCCMRIHTWELSSIENSCSPAPHRYLVSVTDASAPTRTAPLPLPRPCSTPPSVSRATAASLVRPRRSTPHSRAVVIMKSTCRDTSIARSETVRKPRAMFVHPTEAPWMAPIATSIATSFQVISTCGPALRFW